MTKPRICLPDKFLRMVREILRRTAPGVTVWAYGSRVNGDCHEGSDLDLAVIAPVQGPDSQRTVLRVQAAFRESNIPILVQVLDWHGIPESFRREIEKRHVVLQEANPGETNSDGRHSGAADFSSSERRQTEELTESQGRKKNKS